MRWQWPARIVVAAIGIGAAVSIVVYSRRQTRPPEPVTTLQSINPNVVTKGGAGVSHYLKAGRNPVKVTSNGSEEDRSGKRFFTGVLVEGLESDRFTIKGDRLDLEGPEDHPSTFNLSGRVVITTSDGLSLQTETASYDDATGRLNLPKPVTYAKGRISGSAMAAGYDRDRDAWTLLGDAKAHIKADTTGKGAAEATAARMTFVRDQHQMNLEEQARIVGDTQVLTSNTALVTFTGDESAVKLLDLRGAARATPKAGAPGAADQPDMAAETITMTFRPDGVTLQRAVLTGQARLALAGASARSIKASALDVSMAPDGHTLVGLTATDNVSVDLAATESTGPRTITSASLVATGEDAKGLTSAKFEGNPVFTEQPQSSAPAGSQSGSTLRGSARALVLTLGGQIDAIELAEFLQQAEFKSGDATARGDIARYDQAHDVVHFLPNSKESPKPSVKSADIDVYAWGIDLNSKTQDLVATGEVTTLSQSKPPSSPGKKPAAGLFDASEVVKGAAERLEYTKKSGIAVYKGGTSRATLWQGPSSKIQADQISFADDSRNLEATGHVHSVWTLNAAPSATPAGGRGAASTTQTYTVDADSLVYDDAKRAATFKASEVMLTTNDGEIRSAVLTLKLAAAERSLDELRAERNVWARLADGYEAVSDTLVFDSPKEQYVLRGRAGNLARVKQPNKDNPAAAGRGTAEAACNVEVGLHIVIDRKKEAVEQPGQSQAARTTEQQPCSMPLKRGGK